MNHEYLSLWIHGMTLNKIIKLTDMRIKHDFINPAIMVNHKWTIDTVIWLFLTTGIN